MQRTISHLGTIGSFSWGLLAVAVTVFWAYPATAQIITLRNDTARPLIVRGACIVHGMVKRDLPMRVLPGQTVPINLPGDKFITVCDAYRPGTVICQRTVPPGPDAYAVVPIAGGTQVTIRLLLPVPPAGASPPAGSSTLPMPAPPMPTVPPTLPSSAPP